MYLLKQSLKITTQSSDADVSHWSQTLIMAVCQQSVITRSVLVTLFQQAWTGAILWCSGSGWCCSSEMPSMVKAFFPLCTNLSLYSCCPATRLRKLVRKATRYFYITSLISQGLWHLSFWLLRQTNPLILKSWVEVTKIQAITFDPIKCRTVLHWVWLHCFNMQDCEVPEHISYWKSLLEQMCFTLALPRPPKQTKNNSFFVYLFFSTYVNRSI